MKTLIIIPAYNEVMNVPKLVEELNELNYDYIVINDCSTDDSAKVYSLNNISHLDLPLNLGLASVTQVGFKYAMDNDYDCAIVVDGDGQHLPIYIQPLIEKIGEGYDYAIGSRFLTKKRPWSMRMLGSRILTMAIRLKTGRRVSDPTSGMRAMGRSVMEEFANGMNFIAEPDALCHLLRKKRKVCEVQVSMEERQGGESYFASPMKSIQFMYNVLISIMFVQ